MDSKEEYNRQLEAALKALLELTNQSELDLLVRRGVYRADDGYTLPLMRLVSIIAGAHPNFRSYYQESFASGVEPADAIRSFLFKCSQDVQAITQERLLQQDQTPTPEPPPQPQTPTVETPGPDPIDQGINRMVRNFKKSAVTKVAEHENALKVENGELIYLKEGESPPADFKGKVIRLREGQTPPKKLSKYEELFYQTIKAKRQIDYRLAQFDNKLDQRPDTTIVDYAFEQAQHQAELELKRYAQQELMGRYVNPFLEKQVGRLLGKVFPGLETGAEAAASGAASTTASTLRGAAEGLTSTAGGALGGLASTVGGLASSAASTVASGAASAASAVAAATAPVSGTVIAVIIAIAIVIFIVFYFHSNEFAPYNPVPITEASNLTPVPTGPITGGSASPCTGSPISLNVDQKILLPLPNDNPACTTTETGTCGRPGLCVSNPTRIVMHTTWGATGALDVYNYFASGAGGRGVASHFVIGADGKVIQMVEMFQDKVEVAWAVAGYVNHISIELGYNGNYNSRGQVPPAQYQAALKLIKQLMSQYHIPIGNLDYTWIASSQSDDGEASPGIYGHYQLNSQTRTDPGAGFMKDFREDLQK